MAETTRIAEKDDGKIREMASKHEATIDDLYRVRGKAEIVNGELVVMTPAGGLHGYAAAQVLVSLHDYARRARRGVALGDNVGFVVNLPNRKSFCPDAALWTGGPLSAKFLDGAPVFAVEVRSDEDCGPEAERAMAQKRADYFAAGTLVVWDVDVLKLRIVRVFRATDPEHPVVYGIGMLAEAEPAVPAWSMAVDDLFPTSDS
jgi:Uma2 family endonuclease